jgi:hypothetical protein
MHEWLEALQKSARKKTAGVAAEELRRAETECGVPLPGELGDLYAAFNGGEFEGEVALFPLHGEGEEPSVLEKTRKMLVGLPVAGVWRFGLKGKHRHLYAARKAAMVEQGDGGGPLPEWVNTLGDEDWLYGTWDEEKKEMRLYRSLSNMLNVLVPPVEHEQFGDRTFARAIAAVQGALSELAGGDEGEEAQEGQPGGEQAMTVELTDKALERPAVVAAEHRLRRLRQQKASQVPEKPAAKKASAKKAGSKKAPAKKVPAKKAGLKKAPAKKAPAKKAPAKKAPAKKAAARKTPASKAVKKAPAKKAAAARRKR